MKLCIDADTIFRHVNRGLICRPLQSQVESDSNNDIGDVEIDAQGYCDTSGVQSLCVHLNMCNVVVGVNSPGNLSSVALCSRSIRLQPRLHRRRERRTRLLRHQRRAIVVRRSRHLHCRGWRQFQASKQAIYHPLQSQLVSDPNDDSTDAEIGAQGCCGTSGVQSLCVYLSVSTVVVGANSQGGALRGLR